jgi:hypothetical protein
MAARAVDARPSELFMVSETRFSMLKRYKSGGGAVRRVRGPVSIRSAMSGTLLTLLCTGCGIGSAASSIPTPTPITWSASAASCPNPGGGTCLGRLRGGLYQTSTFLPQITYRVPKGWNNYEDSPANFLLVAPGFDPLGHDAGTSDYIAVIPSIAASKVSCASGAQPGVRTAPGALVAWWRKQPGLIVSPPKLVTVGGLHGLVIDLRLKPTWKKACPYSGGQPVVPVIAGLVPNDLDHPMVPGLAMRLYLFTAHSGTLAIELDDVRNAGHLAAYSRIADGFRFSW